MFGGKRMTSGIDAILTAGNERAMKTGRISRDERGVLSRSSSSAAMESQPLWATATHFPKASRSLGAQGAGQCLGPGGRGAVDDGRA